MKENHVYEACHIVRSYCIVAIVLGLFMFCLSAIADDDKSELVAYLGRFDQLNEVVTGVKAEQMSIEFTDTIPSRDIVASCSGGKHIAVYRPVWVKASHTKREMIIFHELGHCVLNREHSSTTDKPSLMAESLISVRAYRENREYYLRELFSGAK